MKNAGLHGLRSDHMVSVDELTIESCSPVIEMPSGGTKTQEDEDEVQGRWGRLVQPEEAQLSQP